MKQIGIVLVAFLGLAASARAQQAHHGQMYAHDSRMYFDYGDPLMTSVIQSPDGRTLDVRVNTASSLFSFLRAKGGYYAVRDMTVDVMEDGNAQPVVSRNTIDTIYATSFDQTTAKDDWHTADQELKLPELNPKMHYTVRVDIRDDVDNLSMRPVTMPLRAPVFTNTADSNGVAVGDVMLFDDMNGETATTEALGNTYMFSRDVLGAAQFRIADSLKGDPMVSIDVRQVSNDINPGDTGARGHVTIPASDIKKNERFAFQSGGSDMTYHLAPDNGMYTALFTVPGKTFEPGKYEITVHVQDGSVTKEHCNKAMIVWQGMPLSLEDPVDAIEPLKHILSADQVAEMSSGSKEEQLQKLYQYWKTQDPTPGTAYNERMATFYARVDYADFNFGSSRLLNGAMTDRGKVYLLYGAPTRIERRMLPGESPVEVWTYSNNVNRVFHFEDLSSHGDYHLTEINNLAASTVGSTSGN